MVKNIRPLGKECYGVLMVLEDCLREYPIFLFLLEITIGVYQVMAACRRMKSTQSLGSVCSANGKVTRCLEGGRIAKEKNVFYIPAGVGIACRYD